MNSEFKVEDVEAAILQKLKDDLPQANVDKIASNDIDKDGTLIAPVPAVRVLFASMTDEPTRDQRRDIYSTAQIYEVFVGARNLRSKGEEDTDAKKLLSQVRASLAGQVLTLADGNETEPVGLSGAERFQFDNNGCWYVQRVTVSDLSNFAG